MDAAAAVLQDTAVIKNEEILEYPQTNFQFRPTNIAMQKVKTFRDFTAFAITVNKQVIYYGFFKPSVSSSSCDQSITMDINWTDDNKINLKLGYPGSFQYVNIHDLRNHPQLIATLKISVH